MTKLQKALHLIDVYTKKIENVNSLFTVGKYSEAQRYNDTRRYTAEIRHLTTQIRENRYFI